MDHTLNFTRWCARDVSFTTVISQHIGHLRTGCAMFLRGRKLQQPIKPQIHGSTGDEMVMTVVVHDQI